LVAGRGGRGRRGQRAQRWQGGSAASQRKGKAGSLDRSSALRTVANRTPDERIAAIAALRRLRFTGAQIARGSCRRR